MKTTIYIYLLKLNEYFYASHMIGALEELGFRVVTNNQQKLNNDQLKTQVNQAKPVFVLFYGYSFLNFVQTLDGPFCLEEMGMPYVTIFADNPLRYLFILKTFNTPQHSVFVADKTLTKMMKEEGFKQVFHLPLCFNPKTAYPRPKNPKYAHKIAYAAATQGWDNIIARRRFWPRHLHIQADILFQMRRQNPGRYVNYVSALKALNRSTSIRPDSYLFSILASQNVLEQRFQMRMEIMESLKAYPLHIYGKGGWKTSNPNHRQHPHLDQNQTLPELYSSALINLSTELHPSCVHQRIYEIHGCGGFVISEYKEEIESQFELGKETVCFKSLAELPGLIDYYLARPEERNAIAKAGYKRVMKDHTVTQRAAELLKILKTNKQIDRPTLV